MNTPNHAIPRIRAFHYITVIQPSPETISIIQSQILHLLATPTEHSTLLTLPISSLIEVYLSSIHPSRPQLSPPLSSSLRCPHRWVTLSHINIELLSQIFTESLIQKCFDISRRNSRYQWETSNSW